MFEGEKEKKRKRREKAGSGETNAGRVQMPTWEGCFLCKELLERHVLLAVLLHNLGHGQLKVLLRDVHAALAQRIHSRLGADTLARKETVSHGKNNGGTTRESELLRTLASAPDAPGMSSAILRRLIPLCGNKGGRVVREHVRCKRRGKRPGHEQGNVSPPHQVHLAGVNAQNLQTRILVGRGKLDLKGGDKVM